MPNGHDYTKEYGEHDYGNQQGTYNCKHHCGCWMGPARSGGPVGVDPFGECPGNPKDGKLVGGSADYEIVVTRRIRGLEKQLYDTQQELEDLRKIKVMPKAKLAEELATMTKERNELKEAGRNLYDSFIELIKPFANR